MPQLMRRLRPQVSGPAPLLLPRWCFDWSHAAARIVQRAADRNRSPVAPPVGRAYAVAYWIVRSVAVRHRPKPQGAAAWRSVAAMIDWPRQSLRKVRFPVFTSHPFPEMSRFFKLRTSFSLSRHFWQSEWVGTQLRALSEHIPIVRGQRARVFTRPVYPSPLTAIPLRHTPCLANSDRRTPCRPDWADAMVRR